MTTSMQTKRDATFVEDLNYRNHPAVKQGVKLYSQFKALAARRKKQETGAKLSIMQNDLAKELGFRDMFQAQSFYRKYQPADYAACRRTKKK